MSLQKRKELLLQEAILEAKQKNSWAKSNRTLTFKFTNSGDIKLLEDIVNPLKSKNVQASTVTEEANSRKKRILSQKYRHPKRKDRWERLWGFCKGEKPKASIYTRLKNAVEKDINESIDSSSSAELKKQNKQWVIIKMNIRLLWIKILKIRKTRRGLRFNIEPLFKNRKKWQATIIKKINWGNWWRWAYPSRKCLSCPSLRKWAIKSH